MLIQERDAHPRWGCSSKRGMVTQEQAADPSSRDASFLHSDCCLCAASPPQHIATAQLPAPNTCKGTRRFRAHVASSEPWCCCGSHLSNQGSSPPDGTDLDSFPAQALWQSDSIKPWFTESAKKIIIKKKRAKEPNNNKKKCPLENNFLLWIFKTSGWRITFSFLCCLSSQ